MVTIATVGEPRGDRAHQRPLAAVAVAAAAEHADARRPRVSGARRAQHVLERVGRVRVVDEHRERLAGVDRLEAARHARAARRSPAATASCGSSSSSRSATTQSTFSTLKSPRSRASERQQAARRQRDAARSPRPRRSRRLGARRPSSSAP